MTDITCSQCGTVGSGRFCAQCGAALGHEDNGLLAVLNLLLRLDAWKTYFRTLLRIAPSPVLRTIEIFEEGDFQATLRILEISFLLAGLSLLGISLNGNDLTQEFLFPVYYAASISLTTFLFYRLARRRSQVQRTPREVLMMLILESTILVPFAAAIYPVIWYAPPAGRTAASFVLAAGSIAFTVYVIRLWKYFWRLSGKRIFCYIMFTGLPSSALSLLVFSLLGFNAFKINDQLAQRDVDRSYGTQAARDYLVTAGPAGTDFQVQGSVREGLPNDNQTLLATAATCLDRNPHPPGPRPVQAAQGPTLTTNDQSVTIDSSAQILPTSTVRNDRKILTDPRTPACLGESFRQSILQTWQQKNPDLQVEMTRTAWQPQPDGATGMARLEAKLTVGDNSNAVIYDATFVQAGHVEAIVLFSRLTQAPDPQLEQTVITGLATAVSRK